MLHPQAFVSGAGRRLHQEGQLFQLHRQVHRHQADVGGSRSTVGAKFSTPRMPAATRASATAWAASDGTVSDAQLGPRRGDHLRHPLRRGTLQAVDLLADLRPGPRRTGRRCGSPAARSRGSAAAPAPGCRRRPPPPPTSRSMPSRRRERRDQLLGRVADAGVAQVAQVGQVLAHLGVGDAERLAELAAGDGAASLACEAFQAAQVQAEPADAGPRQRARRSRAPGSAGMSALSGAAGRHHGWVSSSERKAVNAVRTLPPTAHGIGHFASYLAGRRGQQWVRTAHRTDASALGDSPAPCYNDHHEDPRAHPRPLRQAATGRARQDPPRRRHLPRLGRRRRRRLPARPRRNRLTAVAARRVLAFTPPTRTALLRRRRRRPLRPAAAGRRRPRPTHGDPLPRPARRRGRRGRARRQRQSDPAGRVDRTGVPRTGTAPTSCSGRRPTAAITSLGCPRLPPIFDGVAWGGRHVLAAAVAASDRPACGWPLLPPWYDVDTLADWWAARPPGGPAPAAASRGCRTPSPCRRRRLQRASRER